MINIGNDDLSVNCYNNQLWRVSPGKGQEAANCKGQALQLQPCLLISWIESVVVVGLMSTEKRPAWRLDRLDYLRFTCWVSLPFSGTLNTMCAEAKHTWTYVSGLCTVLKERWNCLVWAEFEDKACCFCWMTNKADFKLTGLSDKILFLPLSLKQYI